MSRPVENTSNTSNTKPVSPWAAAAGVNRPFVNSKVSATDPGAEAGATVAGIGVPNPQTATPPDSKTSTTTDVSGQIPSLNLSGQDLLTAGSAYDDQLAALMRALDDSNTDFENQKSKYNQDYNDSLKFLGWQQPVVDNPDTLDVDESKPGAWNFEDLLTSSGRAKQNLDNDFASRGLLQSSLYGSSLDNLTRSLNSQFDSVNTARDNFLSDLAAQQGAFQNENTLARQEVLRKRAADITAGLAI